jgi:hypothetical protein
MKYDSFKSVIVLAILLCLPYASAQKNSSSQDFTFVVSSALPWTDTALDLQTGDRLEISASGADSSSGTPACEPKGVSGNATQTGDMPLPSAPAGALIARLHAHGASPVLVASGAQLHIASPSHLFLGMNFAGTGLCQGALTVKVHRTSAIASASPSSASDQTQQIRGAQLKSQLSTAAQVFMQGQFGLGSSSTSNSSIPASNAAAPDAASSGASPALPSLKLSDAPLDPELRRGIDGLPRRVNDQFQNLGDMVNFVIVGSQKDVQAALAAATWHIADTDSKKAMLNAVMQTYDNKDYLAMPMSTLYLFGRHQDFGYEMAEPIAMVASRHHFRIWKAPFTWQGREVWVGAGTHDIGFAKDKRNNSVTHKIDPAVDGERDNIGSSLQKTNMIRTLSYYLPPNPVRDARNATGDGYHSDGRLLVVVLF